MAELPPAEWTKRPDLARLADALGPDQLRWVGGAVRDTLAGVAVKDVDAATPLPPHTVIERLDAAGIKTVPTGIEHGTVTALLAQGKVEITTLRRDVSTDGRNATVAFTDDWAEDAGRRDFTLNSLYARRDGTIFLQKEVVLQAALVDKLKAIAANGYDQRIFVRGDDRANYGKVMEVMGLLAASGFTHIGLVTDVVKPEPNAR